jgi:hypothetical protein
VAGRFAAGAECHRLANAVQVEWINTPRAMTPSRRAPQYNTKVRVAPTAASPESERMAVHPDQTDGDEENYSKVVAESVWRRDDDTIYVHHHCNKIGNPWPPTQWSRGISHPSP